MMNSKLKAAISPGKHRNWFYWIRLIMMAVVTSFLFSISTAHKMISPKNEQKIKLTIGDRELTASLRDNKTSRDFIVLLPLELTLQDYVGTEKISDLPKKLSTEDAPSGSNPSIGDIACYSPWGNLAIFYKDFEYSKGLVILGHIDGNIDLLSGPGSVKVKIELNK